MLADVIERINAGMLETVPELHTAVGTYYPEAPAIIWRYLPDRYEGAEQHTRYPQPIRTKVAMTRILCYAVGDGTELGDMRATETLVQQVINVIDYLAQGMYSDISGEFLEADEDEKVMHRGTVYELRVGFRVPIHRVEPTTVLPDSTTLSAEMDFTTSVVAGTPAP